MGRKRRLINTDSPYPMFQLLVVLLGFWGFVFVGFFFVGFQGRWECWLVGYFCFVLGWVLRDGIFKKIYCDCLLVFWVLGFLFVWLVFLEQRSLARTSMELKQPSPAFAQLVCWVQPAPHTHFISHSASLLELKALYKIILDTPGFYGKSRAGEKCLVKWAWQKFKKFHAWSLETAPVCNKKKVQGKTSSYLYYHTECRN